MLYKEMVYRYGITQKLRKINERGNVNLKETIKDSIKDSMSLRYSIRIAGTVTSLSLRKNVVTLWLVLNQEEHTHTTLEYNNPSNLEVKSSLNGKILNFIYSCLSTWKEDNAKGFSDFVSEQMIKDILEEEDFENYKQISSYI